MARTKATATPVATSWAGSATSRREELSQCFESLGSQAEPGPLAALFALYDAGLDELAEVMARGRLASLDEFG